jgi:hypothetical protein
LPAPTKAAVVSEIDEGLAARKGFMDWRQITDEREKYAAYLCSAEWGQLRREVRERCLGVCERCRTLPQAHTHHQTYIRKYAEHIDDLQGVCQPCHDFIHGRSGLDPASIFRERIELKRALAVATDHAMAIEIIRLLTAMPRKVTNACA